MRIELTASGRRINAPAATVLGSGTAVDGGVLGLFGGM
jgi:hypothetical protein